MGIRPTFAGMYTARSGIVASQANIDVTGQNLTNILTPGFSRQRADLFSIGDSGYKSRIANPNGIHIGQGVSVNSTSQLRDASYDIRYRQENTKFAYEETKLSGLEDIKKAFDEFMKGDGLHSQLGELFGALEDVMKNASDKDTNRIVKNQADLVTHLLNEGNKALEAIKTQQTADFEITVGKINSTLERIGSINQLIMEDAKYNNPAHELKDERNMLLDELSGYMKIDYRLDPKNLDELSVNFITADGEKIPLVQGNKTVEVALHNTDGDVDADGNPLQAPHLVLTPPGTTAKDGLKMPDGSIMQATAIEAKDCDSGATGAYFDMMTGEGDFGGADGLNNRGIPYYEKMLDTFANTFAQSMNDLNRGKVTLDANGKFSFAGVKGVTEKDKLTAERVRELTDADGNQIAWVKKEATVGPPATAEELMTPADWEGMTDAKLKDMLKLEANQKLATDHAPLKDVYGTVKLSKDGVFNYLPSENGNDATAKYDLTAERVKELVNAKGDKIQWLKADGTAMTESDWIGMTNEQTAEMLQLNSNQELVKKDGAYLYGSEKALFATNDGSGKIDAGNIKLSKEWLADDNLLTHSVLADAPDSANDNISRFLALFGRNDIVFAENGSTAYTGGLESCISNMQVVVGSDVKKTTGMDLGYAANLVSIDRNRMSVSGVDENEETSNMMMFQKAFSASSRIMTTMDEMLDTLINRTGMVGR